MFPTVPRPDVAPQEYRDAMSALVQIGLSVARMVGRAAEAETALAEAAAAQAIEADRAIAAAFEARHTMVARAQTIAAAFAQVSRAIRLTVLLAERLERGWASCRASDDRSAMARRQNARGDADDIGCEADDERPERPERLTEALDRLESLDVENELADRPVEEVIRQICRGLGLDPAQLPLPLRASLRDAVRPTDSGEVRLAAGGPGREACPPQRRPDG
jgi:hypothetical protein